MCGRYGLSAPGRAAELGVSAALLADVRVAEPRWNIAPSQRVLGAVADRDGVRAARLQWGLIPFWAKDATIGRRLANARGESVRIKPSFRRPFAGQRAIVFADLFYEWQVQSGARSKQPWCVRLHDAAPFVFAALWDRWTPPSGEGDPAESSPPAPVMTCTLITTESNAVMAPIHSRMPVLLTGDDIGQWLDVEQPLDAVQALLRPAAAGTITAWPVSTWVNSPTHDDPACAAPLDAGEPVSDE